MKKKFYGVGGPYSGSWTGFEPVMQMEEADVVILPGGSDWNPALYGDPRHPFTHVFEAADCREWAAIQKAIRLGKHMIGICRGAQGLCIAAGGRLVQHQENPESVHAINIKGKKQILMTSCHHQAQFPWRIKHKFSLLGWTQGLSRFHLGGNSEEMINGAKGIEVEDVYYPHIKGLAIQGHPEWVMDEGEGARTLAHYRELIDLMFAGKLNP